MTLKWEDVDFEHDEFRLRDATTGYRTVHLSPSAVNVLAALPREPGNPWIVPGAKPGTHMADIEGAWQSIRTKAALHDVRIHDIRHSCAIYQKYPASISVSNDYNPLYTRHFCPSVQAA